MKQQVSAKERDNLSKVSKILKHMKLFSFVLKMRLNIEKRYKSRIFRNWNTKKITNLAVTKI